MQVIRDFLLKHNITDKHFVIGVSGGADSLALVLMFKEEFPDYDLVALTVDHQLRPSSAQEAEYVAQVMASHHIEHHTLVWDGKKPETGVEEKAREERYRLLCQWCHAHHFENLVIAHHQRDQIETFLMRLQRGSGLYGLSCMEDIFMRDGVNIMRPLLNISPEVLKEYLNKKNISWVEDESNQCTDYLRVKVRQFLPILEKELNLDPARICSAIQNLQNTKHYLDDTMQNLLNAKIHNWFDCAYSFDYSEYKSWHHELKFLLLGKLLSDSGNTPYQPEAENLLNLIRKMDANNFENATLGGCHIIKSDLRCWIIPEDRENKTFESNDAWKSYLSENPIVRGIKIPAKLKSVLINKKNSQK